MAILFDQQPGRCDRPACAARPARRPRGQAVDAAAVEHTRIAIEHLLLVEMPYDQLLATLSGCGLPPELGAAGGFFLFF